MSLLKKAASIIRSDGWMNAITGLGGGRDKAVGGAPLRLVPLSVERITALYGGDDFAAKIVDKIVTTAMSKGFEIQSDEEGDILAAAQKWRLASQLSRAAVLGRAYGVSALVLGVEVGRMDQPLDPESVTEGSLRYIGCVERARMSVEAYYSEGPLFGMPEVYRVTQTARDGSSTSQSLIHESRMVIFEGVYTPDRIRRDNNGWALSVLQRPYDVLRDTATNWQSTVHMISDASQAVMKIQGLFDMIAEGDDKLLQNRMMVMNVGRSLSRSILLDAEGEDFQQVGVANLSGIPPILEKTWQRLAAAADMPVTVLMGQSPAGMNATGASDLSLWHSTVASYQENVLGPALQLLVEVVARSEGIPLPEGVDVSWTPLEQESEAERAATRKSVAETDKIYIDSGVVLPEEVTKARWGKGEYSPDMEHAVEIDGREDRLQRELESILNEETQEPSTAPGAVLSDGTGPDQPDDQQTDSQRDPDAPRDPA